MQQQFVLEGGRLRQGVNGDVRIAVFTAPTEEERQLLHEVFGIDEHDLASALDPEEIARFDHDRSAGITTIIWKRPGAYATDGFTYSGVTSVGIFLQPEETIVVVSDGEPPVSLEFTGIDTPAEFVLRLMLATVHEFASRLLAVKRTAGEIQSRLNRSLDNRELVRMFDLSEDLFHYVDAINANGSVLTRLRNARHRLGFSEEEADLLDDLIIDNEQLSHHGDIYTRILGGLLDARGNIVNNNMNVLIKNLAVVNVVFLPLGVIAGMGGMSEFTMMIDDYGIDWRIAYPVATVGLVLLGLVIFGTVNAWINRRMDSNGSG